MGNTVTVLIPAVLREKAGDLGINISLVCREALAEKVSNAEKKIGASVCQDQNTPTTALNGGNHDIVT